MLNEKNNDFSTTEELEAHIEAGREYLTNKT
jgi:hypothetical protein